MIRESEEYIYKRKYSSHFSDYKCKCVCNGLKGQEKGVVKWFWLGGGYGSNDHQSSDMFRIIFDFYYFVSSIIYLSLFLFCVVDSMFLIYFIFVFKKFIYQYYSNDSLCCPINMYLFLTYQNLSELY
jgi:hypothetical protein